MYWTPLFNPHLLNTPSGRLVIDYVTSDILPHHELSLLTLEDIDHGATLCCWYFHPSTKAPSYSKVHSLCMHTLPWQTLTCQLTSRDPHTIDLTWDRPISSAGHFTPTFRPAYPLVMIRFKTPFFAPAPSCSGRLSTYIQPISIQGYQGELLFVYAIHAWIYSKG